MNPNNSIECEMRHNGYNGIIMGCDEVGRGPLAGPATVACVAFPHDLDENFPLFTRLDDSKKLSATKREALIEDIKSSALAYSIVDIPPEEIDRLNILQACLAGMKNAAMDVSLKIQNDTVLQQCPLHVLVDGNKTIPALDLPQTAYVKGDARSWSIAAASILAKVHRDKIMADYDKIYPGYGFAQNAGYPTAMHRNALLTLGPTPIHRKSFHLKSK